MSRVAVQVVDRVQTDRFAHVRLQLTAGELGDQHLVLEGIDLKYRLVVVDSD
jgi:hypothetical protein